jgi:hypothetical protein
MEYGIWKMKLLSISGVGRFNDVTPAGLGRKTNHARFRLFNPDKPASGFYPNAKPGAHTAGQSRERMNLR